MYIHSFFCLNNINKKTNIINLNSIILIINCMVLWQSGDCEVLLILFLSGSIPISTLWLKIHPLQPFNKVVAFALATAIVAYASNINKSD